MGEEEYKKNLDNYANEEEKGDYIMLNKKITIYQSEGNREKASNPYGFTKEFQIEPGNTDMLARAVQYDNCLARYKDGYKKGDNFIEANCILADIDNNHSDNSEEWIMHDDVIKVLSDVEFYYYPSRNNMKQKGNKEPRPKEHYIFPTDTLKSVEEYTGLMSKLLEAFPELHFDTAVKGGAQLNFGVENPNVAYHKGTQNLSEFMSTPKVSEREKQYSQKTIIQNIIPQGQRHTFMLSFACSTLKRLGDNEEAYTIYMQKTLECSPLLEEKEVKSIWNDAQKYYHTKIKTSPNYIVPEQYGNHITKRQSFKPQMFTDLGQAELFSKIYYKKLRYSTATRYLYYDGKIWEESDTKARHLAQCLTQCQFNEAQKELREAREMEDSALVKRNKDERGKAKVKIKQAEQYRQYAYNRQNTNRIDATLKEACPLLEIDTKMLDKDCFKLNTPDGTIDLKTKELKPHSFEDYCTKITTKSPSNEGMKTWKEFLSVITCGDKELEEYLQYVAGMIAVGKVFGEHLIIAYGCGKNGKSTFFNLLARVLGSYSGSLSSEVLTANCRKNKSPEYAELRGKRLAIAAELEDGMRLDTSIVKKLCSTDPIQAEKKYKAPFSYVPSHTVVLYTNHLPSVSALDNGTWRRLIVIPFNAVIADNEDIKNYAECLFENAGGAVMKWIVEGAGKYISNDYKIEPPRVVEEAINTYRAENDWISNYISECCEVDRTFEQPSGTLYQDYRKYCKGMGETPKNQAVFNKALLEKGYSKRTTSKGKFIKGLRLRTKFTEFELPQISIPSVTANDDEIQENIGIEF